MVILEFGDCLGDVALLEEVPNPTTYRTRYPCLLLSLSRHDLRHIADLSRSSDQQTELEKEIAATLDRRLDAKLDELMRRRIAMRKAKSAAASGGSGTTRTTGTASCWERGWQCG